VHIITTSQCIFRQVPYEAVFWRRRFSKREICIKSASSRYVYKASADQLSGRARRWCIAQTIARRRSGERPTAVRSSRALAGLAALLQPRKSVRPVRVSGSVTASPASIDSSSNVSIQAWTSRNAHSGSPNQDQWHRGANRDAGLLALHKLLPTATISRSSATRLMSQSPQCNEEFWNRLGYRLSVRRVLTERC
jgi:hypothetical protein